MEIVKILLLILGALAALAGICWLCLWFERRHPNEKYDERQKTARGGAYRIAFWVGIVYYLVCGTFCAMDGSTEDMFHLIMVGLMIQVMAFFMCCVMTGADLPLSGNSVIAEVAYIALGIRYIGKTVYRHWYWQEKMEIVGVSWFDLVIGVCFIVLGVLHLVQILRSRKE